MVLCFLEGGLWCTFWIAGSLLWPFKTVIFFLSWFPEQERAKRKIYVFLCSVYFSINLICKNYILRCARGSPLRVPTLGQLSKKLGWSRLSGWTFFFKFKLQSSRTRDDLAFWTRAGVLLLFVAVSKLPNNYPNMETLTGRFWFGEGLFSSSSSRGAIPGSFRKAWMNRSNLSRNGKVINQLEVRCRLGHFWNAMKYVQSVFFMVDISQVDRGVELVLNFTHSPNAWFVPDCFTTVL